jgi:hypothetical protein
LPSRTHLPLLALPFSVALGALAFLNPIRANDRSFASFLAAAAALILWSLALDALSRRRSLTVQFVPKRQHYLQACAQGSFLIYWALWWAPARAFAPFILAQLLFAYAFDMLLSWSRRNDYTLGFAPFPVIFSINLFLLFRPDWFFFQFAMVALGLLAKETIRWPRDGRRAHIFNPSSFPLAVASLALLATGTTGITWGQEIATTQFFPPHVYLALFLIGLPGQFFFGVTSMTMSAVVTTWLFGRIYFAVTGVYFFYDSYIPIAVFLGMHLLFNDPSTSPRSEAGRIMHGALYGLGTVLFYDLLGKAGLPTFYDKLLPVPLLNLSVKLIDRVFGSIKLAPKLTGGLQGYQRNLAYMSVWAIVFVALNVTQQVGDNHPGQYIPFWQHACDEGRRYACPYLADVEQTACNRGSGWGCNEAGRMDITLSRSGEDLRRTSAAQALQPFTRGCDLKFEPACRNLYTLTHGGALVSAPPTLGDYRILLQGSKNFVPTHPSESLFAVACRQGWPDTCR